MEPHRHSKSANGSRCLRESTLVRFLLGIMDFVFLFVSGFEAKYRIVAATHRSLAEKFGVHETTILLARRGDTFAGIQAREDQK